jgi:phenylpropionate dioxygenase-like ring-hydroxylating dioxygenase large terminal subunit
VTPPDASAPDYKALVQDDRIHASLYTDPRIFTDELERIFHRGWVFVGHESEVPRPGDFVTLDGALLGAPYPGGYAALDKGRHGLARAPRVDAYRGFVFASLAADGPTLAEHLGTATRLIDRSCDLSPAEVELTAGWVRHRCAANWKMLPENDITWASCTARCSCRSARSTRAWWARSAASRR